MPPAQKPMSIPVVSPSSAARRWYWSRDRTASATSPLSRGSIWAASMPAEAGDDDPVARRTRLPVLSRAAGGQPEHRRQDTRHDQGAPGGRLAVPGQHLAGMDVHDLPAFRLLFADEGGAAGLGDVLL